MLDNIQRYFLTGGGMLLKTIVKPGILLKPYSAQGSSSNNRLSSPNVSSTAIVKPWFACMHADTHLLKTAWFQSTGSVISIICCYTCICSLRMQKLIYLISCSDKIDLMSMLGMVKSFTDKNILAELVLVQKLISYKGKTLKKFQTSSQKE